MNDQANRRSSRHDADKEDRHLFWYWLPVAGAGACLTLLAWERLIGL
jgi:hypothetical protein